MTGYVERTEDVAPLGRFELVTTAGKLREAGECLPPESDADRVDADARASGYLPWHRERVLRGPGNVP